MPTAARPILTVLALLTGCAPAIRTDFEGGSLGRVRRLDQTRFVCSVAGQADRDGRNRQASWYYFRVDRAAGREVTVTLDDLVGEYDFKPGAVAITRDTVPLWSADGARWIHFDRVDYDEKQRTLTLRFVPSTDRFHVAHVEPYTPARLEALLGEIGRRPAVRVERIGQSVQGRPLSLVTITNPAIADQGKRVVWMMFRQHAWESGSSFTGEGALRFLAGDDPEAVALRDRVVFKVFPMLDPDGCAAGGVRFNRNGYDVNRNWDTVDLASAEHRRLMPEIHAAKSVLVGWLRGGRRIDLFVTVHNTETGEYLAGGTPDDGGVGERLFQRLREKTIFDPGTPLRPTAVGRAPGRHSVADFLAIGHGVPAFLLELRIARSARLGRPPTSGDRIGFGRGLAAAMAAAVLGGAAAP